MYKMQNQSKACGTSKCLQTITTLTITQQHKYYHILQNNAQFQTLMIKGLPLVYKDTLSNQNIRFIANVIRIPQSIFGYLTAMIH